MCEEDERGLLTLRHIIIMNSLCLNVFQSPLLQINHIVDKKNEISFNVIQSLKLFFHIQWHKILCIYINMSHMNIYYINIKASCWTSLSFFTQT